MYKLWHQKKSGIKKLEDLKGKRIAVGAQNSGVEVNAHPLKWFWYYLQ